MQMYLTTNFGMSERQTFFFMSSSCVMALRGDADFVGQTDEDQGTDAEICTTASNFDAEATQSSSAYGSNKPEGVYNIIVILF